MYIYILGPSPNSSQFTKLKRKKYFFFEHQEKKYNLHKTKYFPLSCVLCERVLLLFLPKHDMFKAYLNILLATQEQRKWYLTSRLRLSVLDLGLRRRELCLRLLVHNGADRCSAGGVETQCLPFYIHSYSRLATFSTVWV